MCGLKVFGALVLAGVLSGCQVKPESADPVQLSKQEVTSLFKGKTVESFNRISGTTSFTYYHPDGSVEQERFWERRTGYWKVNDKSEICLAMEGKPFSCRHIFLEGTKYYKYRVGDQGQLEKIIRYRQFIQGKAI